MGNITFHQTEKQALVQFHQLELAKAIETIEQIKKRIRTLGGEAIAVRPKGPGRPKAVKDPVQRTRTAKPKRVRRTKAQMTAAAKQTKQTTVRSHHKKPGAAKTPQHIQWQTFVPDILKQKGSPITTREILNIAEKKFNVPVERKTMKSLSQILRNMKKAGRITAEVVKGSKQKIKQYSLSSEK